MTPSYRSISAIATGAGDLHDDSHGTRRHSLATRGLPLVSPAECPGTDDVSPLDVDSMGGAEPALAQLIASGSA